MARITVDTDKCKKDGICSRVCVFRMIRKPDDERYPEIIPDMAEHCIACGHCVAACPTGALNHDLVPLAECDDVGDGPMPESDALEILLKSRRSVRNYEQRRVPREMFDRLMEAARYAPSGGNLQDYRFLVCDDPDKLKHMTGMVVQNLRNTVESGQAGDREWRLKQLISNWEEGNDMILYRAPAIIVAHSNTRVNPSQVNCILAMSYVEIMAYALGLGTCYCGYFNTAVNGQPPLRKVLGLPEGHSAAATLLIGYPKLKYPRIPTRNQAKFRYV